MSIRKKVSIEYAIQNAVERLAIEDTWQKFRSMFTRWAVMAENKIASYNTYKRKIFVLKVCGCTAELPPCIIGVMGLLVGDHGCDCATVFNRLYGYINRSNFKTGYNFSFMVVDAESGFSKNSLMWNIQNNQIIISGSNLDQQYITIEALVLEHDENNIPLINENHVDAIGAFIEMRWMMRMRHRKGDMQYTGNEILTAQSEWQYQCGNAIAEDGEMTDSERAEVVAMINDPLSGYSYASWTFSNENYYL